jgi:hypothetical protein
MASSTPNSYQIHTEARGSHWIAWVSRDGSGKPDRAIVIVAASEEEAADRARQWAEQTSY